MALLFRTSLPLVFLIISQFCVQIQERDFFQTGLEIRKLPDGKTEYIATGRASDHAIEKDMISMKRTTACEAARLLIANELNKSDYRYQVNFKEIDREFMRKSEYCRIRGTLR